MLSSLNWCTARLGYLLNCSKKYWLGATRKTNLHIRTCAIAEDVYDIQQVRARPSKFVQTIDEGAYLCWTALQQIRQQGKELMKRELTQSRDHLMVNIFDCEWHLLDKLMKKCAKHTFNPICRSVLSTEIKIEVQELPLVARLSEGRESLLALTEVLHQA